MSALKKIFDNPVVKLIYKIITYIILIFLALLATILIYYVVSSKIYELKGKNYEPYVSLYTIISPSMEPNINVYDVVITVKTDANNIKEGDVITFISTSTLGEGLTITHRVKSVINTNDDIKFRTQGDNNSIPDSSLVSSNNLLGKVVFKIPYLGYIQFFLQSKSGWLFALLIPAMIVVIYDVVKVMRLSNIKQKVNESIQEEEKDPKLVKKQEKLKEDLSLKYAEIIKNEEPISEIKEGFETLPIEEPVPEIKEDFETLPIEEPISEIKENFETLPIEEPVPEIKEVFETYPIEEPVLEFKEDLKDQPKEDLVDMNKFNIDIDDEEIVLPKLKD